MANFFNFLTTSMVLPSFNRIGGYNSWIELFRFCLNLYKLPKHTIIVRSQRNIGSLSKIKILRNINSYFWYEHEAKFFSDARNDSKDC